MSGPDRSPKYQSLRDPLLSASDSFSWRLRARSRNGIPVSPRLAPFSTFPNRGGPWKNTPNIDFSEVDARRPLLTPSPSASSSSSTLPPHSAAAMDRLPPGSTPPAASAAASDAFRIDAAPELASGSDDVNVMRSLLSRSCLWVEVSKQLVLAGPMIGVNVMQYALTIVSLMFVGHLGKLELSGASLAVSLTSALGYDLLMGMASALETLCGQAFGAGQFFMLGVYLQQALVFLVAACVPLTFLFLYMEDFLVLVGQDPIISAIAGKYCRLLLPSIYAAAFLQPLIKFLQTQSIVLPMVLCSGTTLLLQTLLCWILVDKTDLGIHGAAIATGISFWTTYLLLVLYVRFSGVCDDTWDGLSLDAFKDFKEFLRLSVSSGVMVSLEYWSFETLVLFSGLLPNPQVELGAFSICMNTITFNYMIPFGLSAAASTRVANELGAGRAAAAQFAVYVAIGLAVLQASMVAAVLLLVRNVWGWLFSNDPEVVEYVSTLMPFVAMTAVADGIQGVLSGVARGCGWQELGAYINLGAFYGVGLPIGIMLAFMVKVGGKGLWIGLLCGLLLQMSILMFVTCKTNWDREAADGMFSSIPSTEPTIPGAFSPGRLRLPVQLPRRPSPCSSEDLSSIEYGTRVTDERIMFKEEMTE